MNFTSLFCFLGKLVASTKIDVLILIKSNLKDEENDQDENEDENKTNDDDEEDFIFMTLGEKIEDKIWIKIPNF